MAHSIFMYFPFLLDATSRLMAGFVLFFSMQDDFFVGVYSICFSPSCMA